MSRVRHGQVAEAVRACSDMLFTGMAVKVQELLRRLVADGWVQVRQAGSHRQLHHPTKPGTVTVAGKASLDVPPGTLNNVLKQAGLKK